MIVRKSSSKSQEMRVFNKYQELGWRDELWDLVRYFRSLGRGAKKQSDFLKEYLEEKTALPILVQGKGAKKPEIHGSVPLKKKPLISSLSILRIPRSNFCFKKLT